MKHIPPARPPREFHDPASSILSHFLFILFGLGFTAAGALCLTATFRNWRLGAVPGYDAVACLFAGAFFGSIGIGILCLGYLSWRSGKETKELLRNYPAQPWMWKKEWAAGEIPREPEPQPLYIFTFFLDFWIPVFMAIPDRSVLLLSLKILGLIVLLVLNQAALRLWRRQRARGRKVFQLATLPGVIGGALGGTVLIRIRPEEREQLHLDLKCLERNLPGEDDSGGMIRYILWRAACRVDPAMLSDTPDGRLAIPVLFQIPNDCHPTEPDERGRILWRLELAAGGAETKPLAVFEVPVFQTAETVPAHAGHGTTPMPEPDGNPSFPAREPLAGNGATDDGVRRFHFTPARPFSPALLKQRHSLGLIFLCLWFTLIVILFLVEEGIFFIIFALAGLLLLGGLLMEAFLCTTVEFTPPKVILTRRIRRWTSARQIYRGAITRIFIREQVNNALGNECEIVLELRDGKVYEIATNLSHAECGRIVADMRQALNRE